MFERFKSKDGDSEDAGLTTLNLRTAPKPAAQPAPKPAKPIAASAPAPPAAAPPPCLQMIATLESSYSHFAGAFRRFQEIESSGLKPEVFFYLVFPQQGHFYSITTNDGSKTVLPIFNNRFMADAYTDAKKIGAVAAACRIESLPKQVEQWIASGINCYALNLCCRCFTTTLFPIEDLQNEEAFLLKWRLDLANRRMFAAAYGGNAANVIGSNPKQARIWFESVRDHIDPSNPYLHWVIAVLAGMADDIAANAASIKRLEAFGPEFVGKLQGTSFHGSEPGSQVLTLPEAMAGLGVTLGYLDLSKVAKKPDAT